MDKAKKTKQDKSGVKDEIAKKDEEVKELEKLNEQYLNNWKRAEADFLNYKKEEVLRIKSYIHYNQEKIMLDILSLLDIILLAESHIPDNLKEDKWVLGILQIKGQINNLLNNYNVKEIESLDKMVDFNFHEVLQEVETKDKKNGIIIAEIQKGYILNGRVIRPAKVIIAK